MAYLRLLFIFDNKYYYIKNINVNSPSYNWLDKDVCDNYAKTWEISFNEVHYGWMSPGENSLRLLEDIPKGSKILDVGCGMGENIIALNKLNLDPYGIDISDYMLLKASRNLQKHKVEKHSSAIDKRLKNCDMREIQTAFRNKFKAVISAYSLEFLPNINDFEKTISLISEKLESHGTFVFCVTHPTNHPSYPEITNETTSMSQGVPTLMYSIRDVVQTVCNAGLVMERIVEQQTIDPSQITYEDGKKFPYHFRKGRNPFHPLFDKITNKNPHTLIYKTRKQV